LQHDRRWLLIDSNNRFLTQREYSKMATVSIDVLAEGLKLSAADVQPVVVPFDYDNEIAESVQIWNDVCPANSVSKDANEWLSALLGADCRLVHMPDDSLRPVEKEFAVNSDVVSFADAFPFLLLTEASLDDLNGRLVESVPMNRFRPNLVISGASAFAEDDWKIISIGDNVFHVVKPCGRCVMTTVDQEKGVRSGEEPLRTLASYRRKENKVLFGQNLIAEKSHGTVRIGDTVTVLK
jgi:uncharacterized protein